MTKWSIKDFRILLDLLRLAPRVVTSRLQKAPSVEGGSHRLSKELRRLELLGFLYGPIAYIRSAVRLRRLGPAQKS